MKGIMSYKQIISSGRHVRLKGTYSIASRAPSDTPALNASLICDCFFQWTWSDFYSNIFPQVFNRRLFKTNRTNASNWFHVSLHWNFWKTSLHFLPNTPSDYI